MHRDGEKIIFDITDGYEDFNLPPVVPVSSALATADEFIAISKNLVAKASQFRTQFEDGEAGLPTTDSVVAEYEAEHYSARADAMNAFAVAIYAECEPELRARQAHA